MAIDLKQHKGKLIKGGVYGAVVIVLGGLALSYDIGGKELDALSRLPVLERSLAIQDSLSVAADAMILREISELNEKREEQGKIIVGILTELENLTKSTDEMKGDIKELLKR